MAIREASMLDVALQYRQEGWYPVPIPLREKGPVVTGWQNLRLDTREQLSQYFNGEPQNIGVILGACSGHTVDTDLDQPECLAFAKWILPPTLIFGRPSNIKSHWLFHSVTEETRVQFFVMLPGAAGKSRQHMFVELRANGHQTVFPPSTHKETGESILWVNKLPLTEIDFEELRRRAGRIAAGVALAQSWPREKGCRHFCEMALAGILLRSGFTEGDAERFILTIITIATTENAQQRATNVVNTTKARLNAGKPVTGWRTLSKLLNESILIEKVPEWLGYSPINMDEATDHQEERGSASAEPDVEVQWPVLDEAALYGVAGDLVGMIEPHTEADPGALLAQTLAAFGNAIGRNPYFQVEADRHYPNLYAVLVGPTSKGRKGTSKSQIMSLFRSVDETWELERVSNGLSSGEGLIWAVRDPIETKEPIKEKGRIVGYQNVVIDVGVDDKRLFVIESEFASTLRALGRDGNTLSAVIRNAWDSGRLRTMTKNSPARANDAHISIVGHITSDELRRYLDSTEAANGFANRFLWLCVRRSKCLPEGGHLQDIDFRDITGRISKAVDFARRCGRIQFDSAARMIWHSVYPSLSEGQSGLLGAITSRAEAQVVRLALTYALLDCSDTIQEPHLSAALALWEYSEHSARYIFGDAMGDPDADAILAALRSSMEGLTRTQISNLFNRHRTAGQIGRALAVLVKEGKIRREVIETDGRSAEVWLAVSRQP